MPLITKKEKIAISKSKVWNDEVEQNFHNWIKSKDDLLYIEKIQPMLNWLARAIIIRFGNDVEKWYDGSMDQMMQELTTQASIALLADYDKNKGRCNTYSHRVMQNWVYKTHFYMIRQKRDYKKNIDISSAQYHLHEDDSDKESGTGLFSIISFNEFKHRPYNHFVDPEFIDYTIKWWEKHIHTYFFESQRVVMTILNILKNPPIIISKRNSFSSYTDFICKKHKITRQALDSVQKRMRKNSHHIVRDFEAGKKL